MDDNRIVDLSQLEHAYAAPDATSTTEVRTNPRPCILVLHTGQVFLVPDTHSWMHDIGAQSYMAIGYWGDMETGQPVTGDLKQVLIPSASLRYIDVSPDLFSYEEDDDEAPALSVKGEGDTEWHEPDVEA